MRPGTAANPGVEKVKSRALLRLSIPFLSFWVALPATSQLLGENLVGTNIGIVSYWSVEHQFIDQMKASEPWRVQSSTQWNTGEAPDLDSDGYTDVVSAAVRFKDRIGNLS